MSVDVGSVAAMLAAQAQANEYVRELNQEHAALLAALEGALKMLGEHIHSEYDGTRTLGALLAQMQPWEALVARIKAKENA